MIAGLVACQTLVVEVEQLLRDENVPVQHFDKVAFKLVDVRQRDASNRGYILISIVSVVKHFRCDEHRCQYQPNKRNSKG